MSSALLTVNRLDCITVEVYPQPNLTPLEVAQALLTEVVSTILGQPTDDWSIESVHETLTPHDFDLIPPAGDEQGASPIPIDLAWQTHHALAADPRVVMVDLDFDVACDESPDDPENSPASPVAASGTAATASNLAPDWSPKLIKTFEAWSFSPPSPHGRRYGEGILIGHPDSGHIPHSELYDPDLEPQDRILVDLGADFIDGKMPPLDQDPQSGHGLATSSVIVSADNREHNTRSITGVAPKAKLVPLRVAKKRTVIPTPVLLWSGMRRLRKAIYHAVEAGCDVISISLGWLPNKGVHKAVKYARLKNVIVCAAAGNEVRIVVWPAKYKEVIAVAGCNHKRERWRGSSRGKSVDVTGPAENVWKASPDERTAMSSGTSYAVASTAGLAALWLAFHGKDQLITRYPNQPLSDVFRDVLKQSADPPPKKHNNKFGSGIINAAAALEYTLPETSPSLIASLAEPTADAPLSPIAALMDDAEVPGAYSRFLATANLPAQPAHATAATRLSTAHEEELLFHLLTQPAIRDYVFNEEPPPEPAGAAAEIASPKMKSLAPMSPDLSAALP